MAETKFFQFLFGQGLVDELARHYPSPRKRHHVPLWMYVSSQLALRLHGSHSFHRYPLIIRAGGLIDALGPEVATRKVDPETGNTSIQCQGFNTRNLRILTNSATPRRNAQLQRPGFATTTPCGRMSRNCIGR